MAKGDWSALAALAVCTIMIATAFSGCISLGDLQNFAIFGGGSQNELATSITVPYSRYGDVFAYGNTLNGTFTFDGSTTNASASAPPCVYLVLGNASTETYDMFMNRHVAYTLEEFYVNAGDDATEGTLTAHIFCDLDSNRLLSYDANFSEAFSSNDPNANVAARVIGFFEDEESVLPYMHYQGKTIIYGEEDAGEFEALDRKLVNGYDCLAYMEEYSNYSEMYFLDYFIFSDLEAESSDATTSITEAKSEEKSKMPLSSERERPKCNRERALNALLKSAISENGSDGEYGYGGAEPEIELDDCHSIYWLNATIPYPILVETHISAKMGNESICINLTSVLNYVPGSNVIDSGSCWCDGAICDLGEIEKTKWNGFAPDDGSSSSNALKYPLAEAMNSIKNDASASTFKSYLSSHPDAYLQSATYSVYEDKPLSVITYISEITDPLLLDMQYSWHLIFSDWAGNGFDVESKKTVLNYFDVELPVQNTYNGEMRAFALSKDYIPESVPTINGAIRLWGFLVSPDHAGEDVNFVYWGISENTYDFISYYPEYQNLIDQQAYGIFNMEVGYMSNSIGYGINETGLNYDIEQDSSAIQFDLHSGSVAMFYEIWMDYNGPIIGYSDSPLENNGITKINSEYQMSALQGGTAAFTKEEILIGAGGLSLVALIALVLPSVKWFFANVFFVPLYARFKGDDALENENRNRIFQAIRKGKGMSISEIMEETGVSWGSAVYHLSVLEREGHSVSVRKGRERVFFPVAKPVSEYEKDAVLRNISTAQIYELIRRNPGIVQKYISDEMEMKHSSVYWHINRLKDTGLVREEKVGRNSQYFTNAKNAN